MNIKPAIVLNHDLKVQTNSVKKDTIVFSNADKNNSIVLQGNENQNDFEIAKIYIKQARQYIEDREWQQAIIACKNALRIDSNLAEAYKIWGNGLQKLERYAEAIGCYATALKIQPSMHEVYANLGTLYAAKKQWTEAIEYFEKCIAFNPECAGAYRSLARVWEKLDKTEKAWSYMYRALELEPNIMTPLQYCEAADELLDDNETEKAIAFYRYAIQQDEYFQAAYTKLISVLKQLNRQQEALGYQHNFVTYEHLNC